MRGLKKFVALGIALSFALGAWAVLPAFAADVNAPDVDGQITVNANIPNIEMLYVNTSAGASVLNSQAVDVDTGTMTTYYTVNIIGWYNVTGADVDVVDVWLWKDDGTTSPEPDLSAAVDGGAMAFNMGVHLQFTKGAPAPLIVSPVTGGDEEWLVLGTSTFTDGILVTQYLFDVAIDFIPMQQVRAANGDGAWSPVGGPFGGGVAETQSDNMPPFAPLNDLDTWNVKAVATDTDLAAPSQPSWDEFGVFIYTEFALVNQPGGGNVAGTGAPGTTVNLNPVGDWTYRANAPYDLSVNISTMYGVLVPANSIAVSQVSLVGGEIAAGVPFAVGVRQYLLGDGAAATAEGPVAQTRATTTTTGGGDGTGTGAPVTWTVNIPAVPEDTYVGAITYHLDPDYS
jgi:hypothetical protein